MPTRKKSNMLMDSLRIVSFKEAPSVPSKQYGLQSTLAKTLSKTIDLTLAARNGDSQMILVVLQQDVDDPLPIINACDKDGFSPLHYAARYDHPDIISALMDFNADINIKGKEDQTPLHIAAKYNSIDSMKELIKRKADVHAKNQFGLTPLHFTCRRGFEEAAALLLTLGKANANRADNDMSTPLHGAAAGGHERICKLLLENNASILCKAGDKSTPLHAAAGGGNTNIMRFIFLVAAKFGKKSMDLVDELDALDNTPLHLAVQNGNFEAVKLCVDYGANINAQRFNMATPLHLAAQFGHLNIVKMLVERKARLNVVDQDRRTPLHKASLTNKLDVVKYLVEQKANINLRDAERFTAFMCACWMGHLDVVKYLLSKGSSIDIPDSSDRICLHWAVKGHRVKLVEYLLKCGCLPLINCTDWRHQTPLHYAADRGDLEIIAILLSYGASLMSKDDEEKMPLHLAVENGHHLAAITLIEPQPGMINSRDESGRTPLHLAAMHGHFDLVKELIERGADVNSKDDRSWTPIDYAASKGYTIVIEFLLKNHAAIHSVDKNKNTPLHLAAASGHTMAVNLLLDYGADTTRTNQFKYTPLDLAIEHSQRETSLAFVNHSRWHEALSAIGREGYPSMRGLIGSLPDVAKAVMNRCISTSPLSEQHPDFAITYDFRLLTSHPNWEGNRFFGLKDMVINHRETLLNHPLSRQLLHHKWNTYGKWIYYPAIISYVIYLATITTFTVFTTSIKAENEVLIIQILQVGLVLMSCVAILIQLVQIFQKKLLYFTNWTKLLDWAVATTVLFYVVPAQSSLSDTSGNKSDINYLINGQRPQGNQVAVGAAAILLAWCHFLLYLQRFTLGTYVTMFVAVLKSVVRVLLLFGVFIIGFGMSFFLLAREEMASFRTIPLSLLRVVIMLLGEIEYDDFLCHLVDNTSCNTEPHNLFKFPEEVGIILAIFCLLMPIVVMNLLVGLAVGDIDSVRHVAGVARLQSQVFFIDEVDAMMPRSFKSRFFASESSLKPNIPGSQFGKFVRPLFVLTKKISPVAEFTNQESKMERDIATMTRDFDTHDERLKCLQSEINSQRQELRSQRELLEQMLAHMQDGSPLDSQQKSAQTSV